MNHVIILGKKDNPYPYIKISNIMDCTSETYKYSTVINESIALHGYRLRKARKEKEKIRAQGTSRKKINTWAGKVRIKKRKIKTVIRG